MRKRVYIACPITGGDRLQNFGNAVATYRQLIELGYAPLCPAISMLVAWMIPEIGYEDWLGVDLAWVIEADAVLRLPGYSPGADREEEWARMHEIPVLYSVDELRSQMPA